MKLNLVDSRCDFGNLEEALKIFDRYVGDT
jgi:hypothetical protein